MALHTIDTGEIDDWDEIDEDSQMVLVWCETHRDYEWHWVPTDLIGSGKIIQIRKGK